ncbi:MAG: hypothetical protein AB7P97_20385 [Hyphomonadaceae bacterium]
MFNERGPEGFELVNGPRRAFTQFPFTLVANTALKLLPANFARVSLIIQNGSTTDVIFIGFGGGVSVLGGFGLIPGAAAGGGGNFFGDYMVQTDDVWAICAAAAIGVCGEGVMVG